MLPNCKQIFNEIQYMIYELNNNIYQANALALKSIEIEDFSLLNDAKKFLINFQNSGNIIDNEIIKAFALFGPEAMQLRKLVSFLKIVNELVNISEYIKNYIKDIKVIIANGILDDIKDYLIQIHRCNQKIFDILNLLLKSVYNDENFDYEMKYSIIITEDLKIDDLNSILEKEILEKFSNNNLIDYLQILKVIRRLHKCSDRSVTISRLLLFAVDGGKIKSY